MLNEKFEAIFKNCVILLRINNLSVRYFLVWADWAEWSACTQTCGEDGRKERYRDCMADAWEECLQIGDGTYHELAFCNTDACPRNIFFEYSFAQSV
jgi:hypothetical protein